MTGRAGRVVGIDLARGIAIVGMFALHAVPADATGAHAALLMILDDQRAQILFAVLDGVVLGILSDAGFVERSCRPAERRGIAIRALVLLTLGMLLDSFGSGIVVILDYYGVMFLMMLAVLYLHPRILIALSLVSLVLGPWATDLASRGLSSANPIGWMLWPPPVATRVLDWLLTGQYPACCWLGYVLVGLVMWRTRLALKTDWRVVACTTALTAAGAMLAPQLLGSWGVTASLISSTAAAVLVIHLCLLMRLSAIPLVFVGFVAMGRSPITLYTLHVISFAVIAAFVPLSRLQSIPLFWCTLVMGACLASIWLATMRRGPLERVIHALATNVMTQGPARPAA